MYRVFLADADAAMRDFYRGSLPQSPREFQIVGEAPDGEIALSMLQDVNAIAHRSINEKYIFFIILF